MGLFEELLYKTKSAVDIVGEKAGHFVDISKLTMSLAELKSSRKKKFESLGEAFYLSNKDEISKNNSDFSKMISDLKDIDSNIDKLSQEIAKIKNKLVCKKCGNSNAQNAKYCCICGSCLNENECSCKNCECDSNDEKCEKLPIDDIDLSSGRFV